MSDQDPGDDRDPQDGPGASSALSTLIAELRRRVLSSSKQPVFIINRQIETRLLDAVRKLVSANHPLEGRDVVDDAMNRLRDALLNPRHADYALLQGNPKLLIKRRVVDAVRRSQSSHGPEVVDLHAKVGEGKDPIQDFDWPNAFGDASHADVAHILSKIKNRRRVEAFQLYMHRPQYHFVALFIGKDEKTARAWVEYVRERVRKELEL